MASRRIVKSAPGVVAESIVGSLDFSGLDQLLGYRLRRAHGAVHRHYLAMLDGLKLTQKQAAVLWLVMSNPGVAQGAIGSALGMDRATMMVLVNRLEAKGLVRRLRSRVDARRRELQATAAGQRLLKQARQRIARHESQMQQLFSAAELRTLERLLGRLQEIGNPPPPPQARADQYLSAPVLG